MEKKTIPFQKNQMLKIIEVLGNPTKADWPDIDLLPDFPALSSIKSHYNNLSSIFNSCHVKDNEAAFDLLKKLLIYDPKKRITASEALEHPYFLQEPRPTFNAFAGQAYTYLPRKLTQQDSKSMGGSEPQGVSSQTKRKDDKTAAQSRSVAKRYRN